MAPSKMLKFKRRLWAVEVQNWRAKPGHECHPLFATFRAMCCIRRWVLTDVRNNTLTAYGWGFRGWSLEA
jgi:hypothetical protein